MFSPWRTTIFVLSLVTGLTAHAQREFYVDGAEGFYEYDGGCLASSVTIQDDGKIVAAGWIGKPGEQQMIVARFDQDGQLDQDFGVSEQGDRRGWTVIEFPGDCRVKDVEIDPKSGKVLLAGWAHYSNKTHLAVVRLKPNGEVDRDFQDAGVLLHQFESQTNEGAGFDGAATHGAGLAIDMDGNLIVAGRTRALGKPEPFVSLFTRDGEHVWSRKHGTQGFDDGANAVAIPKKPKPAIYTAGFSVITNTLRKFSHDGAVKVYQSSFGGFGQRAWCLAYDDSSNTLVSATDLGRDMVIRRFDDRPEVIAERVYLNPFQQQQVDSVGRGIEHLTNGRFAVAGHGRPYGSKDNSGRRFLFALYENEGPLVTHDRADFGGVAAAAYGVATHQDKLIALVGRVFKAKTSGNKATFKMGLVLYDGEGKRIGDPWTFEP